MKRMAAVSLALLLTVGVASVVLAHGPAFGRGSGGYGYGMGPGMMHGYGGYGMMGPGGNAEDYHPCGLWGTEEPGKKLTKNSVKDFLHDRIEYNPNLKIGKITEKDKYFIAEIVTKDNSIVEKLQIDKETGSIRPVY